MMDAANNHRLNWRWLSRRRRILAPARRPEGADLTFFLPPRVLFVPLVFAMIACGGGSGTGTPDAGSKYQLSMSLVGTGSGRVTSNPPATIDCTATCSASLDAGSSVTLTAAPAAGSEFIGWSGAC